MGDHKMLPRPRTCPYYAGILTDNPNPIAESRKLHRVCRRSVPGHTAVVPVHRHVNVLANFYLLIPLNSLHSLVLYLIYYPPHLKYVAISPSKYGHSSDWRLSIILAWAVLIHLYVRFPIPHSCPVSRALLTVS